MEGSQTFSWYNCWVEVAGVRDASSFLRYPPATTVLADSSHRQVGRAAGFLVSDLGAD